jgi:hypothetical protein
MTYLEWNKAFFSYYFKRSYENDFFVLNATAELLIELGEGLENSVEDFIEAIKVGLVDSNIPERYSNIFPTNFNIIDKALKTKTLWRTQSSFVPRGMQGAVPRWNDDYPPYLAYLVFLVLKVQEGESQYWHSINNIIGTPNVRSQDGQKVIELFEDLKKYSKDVHQKNFYFTNIYSGGGRKYVGTIYSQLPLTQQEENNIINFYKDSGITKQDIYQLSYQEIIDLVINTGNRYFKNSTVNLLKRNDNPILTYLTIESLKRSIENKEDWEINFETIEENARERIKTDARLLLTFYPEFKQFTFRVGSSQDFSKITFENGYYVEKNQNDVSENIRTDEGKHFLIKEDLKKIKLKYEGKELKFDKDRHFILLDYYEKNIYVQSKQQQDFIAYFLVFNHTEIIQKYINDGNLLPVEIALPFIDSKLYKSNRYLRLKDDDSPRITFKGGAKKETGVYSKYWLPEINFHYAEDCSLEILIDDERIHFETKCPYVIEPINYKEIYKSISNSRASKAVIRLRESSSNDYIVEKELSFDITDELLNLRKQLPFILNGIEDYGSKPIFSNKLHIEQKLLNCYDWHQDKLLIELSSIAGKEGFIPSQKLKQVLYNYLKEAYVNTQTIEERKLINYQRDLRDPLIKNLQGLGFIKKSNDSKGNFKGIIVSSPYLLPVSFNPSGEKTFVLRGARNVNLLEKLKILKEKSKIIDFGQMSLNLFSNEMLNTIFPSEIYFKVWNINILEVAETLDIQVIDRILENSLIDLLPKNIDVLVVNNDNYWYGNIDFDKTIDNPLNEKADDFNLPILLAYPTKQYLQPSYVLFEKNDKKMCIEKNWGIFYVKVKRKIPIMFIGCSWYGNNRTIEENRLYIREHEPIPDEIFNILCLANRVPPTLMPFSIKGIDCKDEKYYEFERIDLKLVYQLIERLGLKESTISITNPKDLTSTIIS